MCWRLEGGSCRAGDREKACCPRPAPREHGGWRPRVRGGCGGMHINGAVRGAGDGSPGGTMSHPLPLTDAPSQSSLSLCPLSPPTDSSPLQASLPPSSQPSPPPSFPQQATLFQHGGARNSFSLSQLSNWVVPVAGDMCVGLHSRDQGPVGGGEAGKGVRPSPASPRAGSPRPRGPRPSPR